MDNNASPSPFIHRVISKPSHTAAPAATRKNAPENVSQPEYPDLSQNLNSFPTHNTDSGYHGMPNDDEMVLPGVQVSQVSTQPVDEPMEPIPQDVDLSIGQQTTDDSFHTAQEREETAEPMNVDPTPTQEQRTRSQPEDVEPESSLTPTIKTQPKPQPNAVSKEQLQHPGTQRKLEQENQPVSKVRFSPAKSSAIEASEAQEATAKEDTVLDNLDDVGSPSDGSTPERPLVRKSSLTFASLPAREPLAKSMGGSRISRTSHVDIPKLNGRSSYFGRQTGGHRMTQPATEDNADSGAMDVDDEKEADGNEDMNEASKLHNKKSTQTLHERISMLSKLQPSRPKKSIPSVPGLSTGQVAYPELPAAKTETRVDFSSQKARETPVPEPMATDEDDGIKPLSSPQRPDLPKSKTTNDVVSDSERSQPTNKRDAAAQGQHTAESERPKSSASLFSSPRQLGHQQSASVPNIAAEASTTPGSSPKRVDGHLSASKMRLQSIMKTAKGLFTSTGSSSARMENSSPEQARVQAHDRANAEIGGDDHHESQPTQVSSPSRQEGRRTRNSTQKEEKRRQKELEDRQREEARVEKAREQEKQRAIQLKASRDKSSVEPEERAVAIPNKPAQQQRPPSREPESSHESGSKLTQPKQNDRRPVKPTREPVQKPKPQPVSIRLGSTLTRQMPLASSVSSATQDSTVPAPATATATATAPSSKPSTLKKKGSNSSLQTASSTSSFKSSVSSQTQAQRKAQLANERKKEQEEREARRKEEQKREQERKRAAQQQQEEARRQEMRSRAEAERERRERSAQEDPKKAAHMQAIEKRRLENARRQERQGSQQPTNEVREATTSVVQV